MERSGTRARPHARAQVLQASQKLEAVHEETTGRAWDSNDTVELSGNVISASLASAESIRKNLTVKALFSLLFRLEKQSVESKVGCRV